MRFWDKVKISFKSIINNRSRSILTIIIVFIVSSLILAIMMIALNFANNGLAISEESVRESTSYIYARRYDMEGNTEIFFDNEEIVYIANELEKNRFLFNTITIDDYHSKNFFIPDQNYEHKSFNNLYNFVDPYYFNRKITSFNIPLNVENSIIDGDIWTDNDVNTNYIWVTDKFIKKKYEEGLSIKIGDSLWLNNYHLFRAGDNSFYSLEFVVKGIISIESIKAHNRKIQENDNYSYDTLVDESIDVFCDMSYLANNPNVRFLFNFFRVSFIPPETKYDFNQFYKDIKGFVDVLDDRLKTDDPIHTIVESSIISEFQLVQTINAFIIAFASGLGIFVLLLSIGSVANTIIISVDKNKKLIGLMKALGLKQNAVEDIVKIETTITILFGIALSTVSIFMAMPLFVSINNSLINSIYYYQLTYLEYTIKTNLPYYLPFGVAIVFILTTLLFSKSSLRDIAKMDVITILSEVS